MADPVEITPVSISPTTGLIVGGLVVANHATWDQEVTRSWQWSRVPASLVEQTIPGAISDQYRPVTADVGCGLRVREFAFSVTTPPAPGGTVTDVFPGEFAAKYAAAVNGETLYLRGGTHNRITCDRAFSSSNRVKIITESGSLVKGVTLPDGASGHTFGDESASPFTDTFVTRILAGDTPDLNDISVRAFSIEGHVTYIKTVNSRIAGGFVGFSPYSGGTACSNIDLFGSIIESAWGDLSHPNNCTDLVIDHNIFRNPQHLTSEHHDCFQPSSTHNFQFTRNICYWTSGPGAFAGYTTGYLGQCCMLSGNAGANSNGLIANNLMHHYNGRAINMNNTSQLYVVNNTIDHCGDGIGVTIGTGMSGHEIWNNIMECAYLEGTAPAYFDYNWLTGGNGYLGNIRGTNYWTGAPGWVDTTNYELTVGSPARGKGINRANTPTVDLDGNTRTSLVLGCRV